MMARTLSCGICGADFVGNHSRSRYCGADCARLARNARAAAHRETPEYRAYYKARLAAGKYRTSSQAPEGRRKPTTVVHCRYCKAEMVQAGRQVRVKCGAKACTYHYNRDRTSLQVALRWGVEIGEPFSYLDVLARDGWVCQICAEPIDPTERYPSPGAATVDHIVPLSKGGPHAMLNVQAAHYSCNCKKSDITELADSLTA